MSNETFFALVTTIIAIFVMAFGTGIFFLAYHFAEYLPLLFLITAAFTVSWLIADAIHKYLCTSFSKSFK